MQVKLILTKWSQHKFVWIKQYFWNQKGLDETILSTLKSQLFIGCEEFGDIHPLLANYFKIPCQKLNNQYSAFETAFTSVLTSTLEVAVSAIKFNLTKDCTKGSIAEQELQCKLQSLKILYNLTYIWKKNIPCYDLVSLPRIF